jgi:hypothetical protein
LLLEYIQKCDVTTFQAIAMTKDIMFNNANTLYNLRYQPIFDETVKEAPRQIAYNTQPTTEPFYSSPGMPSIPPAGATIQPATSGPVDPRSGSPYAPPSFPPPPTVAHVYDDQTSDSFMKRNPEVRFVYVQWLDYTSKTQTRIVPIKEFTRMIREHDRISTSHSATGLLPTDDAGQIYIEPDLRSLRRTNPKDPLPSATVLSYWRSESGAPLPSCPRTSLETIINTLQHAHATTLLVSFELSVAFPATQTKNRDPSITSLPHNPSAILLAFDAMNIDVLQCHANEQLGGFTFHLAPLPPLLAVDTLLQARDTIARMHDGNVMTRTPLMSLALNPATHDEPFFLGGVRAHAPALAAFTPASLSRDIISRTVPGRWSLPCAGGSANMYVALAAIIAAGLLGLQSGAHEFVASETQMGGMPLDALRADTALREVLGDEIVSGVIRGREADVRSVGERGFERQGERGYERQDERGYERVGENEKRNERWSEIRDEAERRNPGVERGFDQSVERRNQRWDERMVENERDLARGAETGVGRDASGIERGISSVDQPIERRDQRWDERMGENEMGVGRHGEIGVGRDISGMERRDERRTQGVGIPGVAIPGAVIQDRGFERRGERQGESPHERERVIPVVGMPPGVGVQGAGGQSVGIPGVVIPGAGTPVVGVQGAGIQGVERDERHEERQHARPDERRDVRETRFSNVAREDESSEDESEDTSEDERERPVRSAQRDV